MSPGNSRKQATGYTAGCLFVILLITYVAG